MKLQILIILFSSIIFANLPQRPRFVFHGLNAECPFDKREMRGVASLDENHNDLRVKMATEYCIETGALTDSMINLETQAKDACDQIKKIIIDENGAVRTEFLFGFHILGYSQGGLLARIVYKTCHRIRPYIATLITDGSPNLGLNTPPDLKQPAFENLDFLAIKQILNGVSPLATQLKESLPEGTVLSYEQYQNQGNSFSQLAPLIKGLLEDKDSHYLNLEMFVAIHYSKDSIILPHSSQSFGINYVIEQGKREDFSHSEEGKWENFRLSKFGNYLKLKELWNDQRFWNCRSDSDHLEKTREVSNDFRFIQREICQGEFEPDQVIDMKALYSICSKKYMNEKEKWEGLKCDQKMKDQLLPVNNQDWKFDGTNISGKIMKHKSKE